MNEVQPLSEKSRVRTLLVAVAVALVCSTAVTTAVQYLRPVQAAWADLARNTTIVRAAYGRDGDDTQIVEDFLALQTVYVDVATSTLKTGSTKPPGKHFLPVYIAQNRNNPVFVFPVTAKGMWSDIECYIALDATANTIVRLEIYKHGETPGIGDRIEEPQWLDRFAKKIMYDPDGLARLHVGKDATVPAQHQVDAISGATITSVAIGSALRTAFGPGGYANIRAQLLESFAAEAPGVTQ